MDSKNGEVRNWNTYPSLFYEIHLVLDDQLDESLFQKNVRQIAYRFRLSHLNYPERIAPIVSSFKRKRYFNIGKNLKFNHLNFIAKTNIEE